MTPPTKATQKRLGAALVSFHSRYESQWGEQRWRESLYPALAQPTTYSAVVNRYAIGEDDAEKNLCNVGGAQLGKIRFPEFATENSDSERGTSNLQPLCFEYVCPGASPSAFSMESNSSAVLSTFPAPKLAVSNEHKLLTHWNMDAASVLVAHMLDVQPGDRVLDMCAAPGGKSIVLAQRLFPHLFHNPISSLPSEEVLQRGCLHVNEFDSTRYKRLASNLKAYLPPCLFATAESPQSAVKIFNEDLSSKNSASSLPLGVGRYDKVLIDAPCSSERHVIHAHEKAKVSGQIADEILNWKSSHVTTLARTQIGLLQTALKAVRIGGTVLYATCALGSEENDGVIERVIELLKSERKRAKRDGLSGEPWDIKFHLGTQSSHPQGHDTALEAVTETTKFGRIALPDRGKWGPLYFSVMQKVERKKMVKHKSERQKSSEAGTGYPSRVDASITDSIAKGIDGMTIEGTPVAPQDALTPS